MSGQHGRPRGSLQGSLTFFQNERQEKKPKWHPATPCPPGKEGKRACCEQTGLHQRCGSAISHPCRGAQRDVGSSPMPKSSVTPPGRQLAGTGQGWGTLGLLVLTVGTGTPCWDAAGDTPGLLGGTCPSQLGKGYANCGTWLQWAAIPKTEGRVRTCCWWL